MKILTIAATPFFSDRGCHIRIYNEAKYLQKLGNEIRIVTYDKGLSIDGLDTKRIFRTFFYRKISPGFSWMKIWADLKLLFLAMSEMRKFSPDIIHAHLYEGMAIGHLARFFLRKKIPVVVDLQGDLNQEFESYNKKNNIAKLIFTRLAKIVINWADWVVISSQNSKKYIEQVYDKKKISIVEDGIDLDLFSDKEVSPGKEISAELDRIRKWKGNGKILIYAGGMEESKGVGDLIRELEHISSNWKLVLFGKGSDRQRFEEFVQKKSLGHKIYFAKSSGYFDLPYFLSIADVGIDPKNNSTEGSGKLINYMAAGLPVVCFQNQNNYSLVGEGGIYLTNISELENKLNEVDFNQPPKYNLEFLNAENIVEKFEIIFSKIK